ncbi:hypothetical protein VYU27_005799 [Nannochloropsis oceanica]
MAVNLLREEEDVETASSISHTTASTALLYLPPSGSPSPPSTPSTSAETTTATASKEQRHRLLLGLGLGQILSLLIAGTGIFSSLLAEQGLSLPATQACLTYILLSLHLTRRPRGQPLHVTWWKYLVLAAIDLEGNYLVVLSFRYTSITSVLLLDGFAIPCTMLLSRLYLKSRFQLLHFVGVVACLAGLGVVVYSDYRVLHAHEGGSDEDGGQVMRVSSSTSSAVSSSVTTSAAATFPHALEGDLLTLLGAALYACSNVLQELVLKTHDNPHEFLGMLGGFGFLLASLQALFVEWGREGGRKGEEKEWEEGLGYMFGFALTLATMYTLTAIFLREADATLFNLSLLTSDVYAVLYRYFAQHQPISWLYGLGFLFTLGGLGLYHVPGAVNPRKRVRGGEVGRWEGVNAFGAELDGGVGEDVEDHSTITANTSKATAGAFAGTVNHATAMGRPTYVRLLSKRANFFLSSAVLLKCLTLGLYLLALSHRNGWANSETTSSNGLITYTGHWGLFVVHFEGLYKAGGVEARYTSTEAISGWASVAGGNSTVLHKVRTVQAFSVIGGIVKILGTVSFISGRFAARTATQALTLLDKGRAFNIGFLLCNLLVTSIWASLPENAFFFFCNVYPQQEGASSCISTHFKPPLGNSSWQGRSYSFDLVVAATVCAVIAAVAAALARRTLRRLAEEEGLGLAGRGGGGRGGDMATAILDLDQPLVSPSAPPEARKVVV